MRVLLILALALGLAACEDESAAHKPEPRAMTAEAVGFYCQMDVLEHPGPKGQIFLEGFAEPIWFPQVRDAIAFLLMPEQNRPVVATFVSDMGAAPSWEMPGNDNWVDAELAYFVVGSQRRGGMGAPEVAPFSDRSAAESFAARHGGEVMALGEIPAEVVLAPVELVEVGTPE